MTKVNKKDLSVTDMRVRIYNSTKSNINPFITKANNTNLGVSDLRLRIHNSTKSNII